MLSKMALLPNFASKSTTRNFTAVASTGPPLMWRIAHGFFDPEVSMAERLPGIPEPTPLDAMPAEECKMTRLSNGVRVVSQDQGGLVSSLGLFIGAGSRNEMPHSSGVTHLLERLAYKGSSQRSKYKMIRDMERTGAMFAASAARETLCFTAEGMRDQVGNMVHIMAEAALQPACAVSEEEEGSPKWDDAAGEIKSATTSLKAELEEFKSDAAGVTTEAVHAAAFHGNTVGLPLVIPKRRLDQTTPAVCYDFISGQFVPGNLVFSAANMNHAEFVRIIESALGGLRGRDTVMEPARYTGGSMRVSGDGPAHFAIGLEGVSWQDQDLVPACVLHALLGGGGSFSSGGPGKGMYTRLYSEILNRNGWISSAMAFHHCYTDTGIFGIHASCGNPQHLNDLIEVVSTQVGKIPGPLFAGELDRAKAMTLSSLILNLESRGVVCEDMGRQLLTCGRYQGPQELAKQIAAVTEDDVRRVAARMLASQPAIVLYGEEYATHEHASIVESIKAQAQIVT